MVYAMLDEADYAHLRASADRLLGTTHRNATFNPSGATPRDNTILVFLNLKRLNRPDGFDLIIRLTRDIAAWRRTRRLSSSHVHRYLPWTSSAYREELDHLASLSPRRSGSPSTTRRTRGRPSFSKAPRAARLRPRAQRLTRAA
jgi:hypothetical protein